MRDTVIVGGYEYRHADGQWGIRKVGADVPFGPVTWPHTVAMIERIRELEALAAATRVTEEMVERGARWLHSVQHVPAGTRWEHATELVRERYRARAEGLLTAALEGPRD